MIAGDRMPVGHGLRGAPTAGARPGGGSRVVSVLAGDRTQVREVFATPVGSAPDTAVTRHGLVARRPPDLVPRVAPVVPLAGGAA
ncbi:hypothetical protein ACFWVC_23815 [Streptomyces sp. NPDC058691]|uniref:hypothetical protein n=1 Tax=Streptomyces sp. NPDC058691 TaxID=3346601 RepID=UPI00364A0032